LSDVGIFGIIGVISLQKLYPKVWHILLETSRIFMNIIFASIHSFPPGIEWPGHEAGNSPPIYYQC